MFRYVMVLVDISTDFRTKLEVIRVIEGLVILQEAE
jgi:hypothetical protein